MEEGDYSSKGSTPPRYMAKLLADMQAMRADMANMNERMKQNERGHERRERRVRDDEHGRRNHVRDTRIKEVKLEVPHFHGKDDVEAYLEWEMKIEQLFVCHNIEKEKKMKIAILGLQNYALYWWTNQYHERRRLELPPIEDWEEFKTIMRKRHVPFYYGRELLSKLQRLTQGSKSVEQYRKEMERCLIRANIREEERATISRFLGGLNSDICDVVELLPYVDLDDLVQQAIKVEQQLKRKGSTRRYYDNYPSNSSWKDKQKEWKDVKDKDTHTKSTSTSKGKNGKDSKPSQDKVSKDSTSSNSKTSSIKCFKCLGRGHIASQCPTKKVMIVKGVDHYSSVEEGSSSSSPNSSDSELVYSSENACGSEGDLLIVRRLLGTQCRDHDESQRENIFHTRCYVRGKLCSLIVDGGSCANCASVRLVQKLGLKTTPHPRPYKLQWLNEKGEMEVNKQVKISFSIGNYSDEVVCDVVPMEAGHILLGRPWQFDKHALHDGTTNKISFVHNEKRIVLIPLTPKQVMEDQIKMKIKRDKEKVEALLDESEKRRQKKGKALKEKVGQEHHKGKEVALSMKEGFLTREHEVKGALYLSKIMFLVYCKGSFTTNALIPNPISLPSVYSYLVGFEGNISKEIISCKEASLNPQSHLRTNGVGEEWVPSIWCPIVLSFETFVVVLGSLSVHISLYHFGLYNSTFGSFVVANISFGTITTCFYTFRTSSLHSSSHLMCMVNTYYFLDELPRLSNDMIDDMQPTCHYLSMCSHILSHVRFPMLISSFLYAIPPSVDVTLYSHSGFMLREVRWMVSHSFFCAFIWKHLISYSSDHMPHSFTCAFLWEPLNTYFDDLMRPTYMIVITLEIGGFKRLVFDPGGLQKKFELINGLLSSSIKWLTLCPFDIGDEEDMEHKDPFNSRSNSLEEGGDDVILGEEESKDHKGSSQSLEDKLEISS